MLDKKEWTPEKLRNARLQKGLTQTQLGGMLGYSAMAVSHFEHGVRPIPSRSIIKLNDLLDKNAKEPLFKTIHSPKNKQRTLRYDVLVSEFQQSGFTENQAKFLINLLDQFIPIF